MYVRRMAGSTAGSFTMERTPIMSTTRFISWHSDAANDTLAEELSEAGLGGYACGYWWTWPLSAEARALPVVALELIAWAVNFFVFGQVFTGFIEEGSSLLLHCDALPAVAVVAFGRSRSRLLTFVLNELEALKCHLQSY